MARVSNPISRDDLDAIVKMLEPILLQVAGKQRLSGVSIERWRQDIPQVTLTWPDPAEPDLRRRVALWAQGTDAPYDVQVSFDLWHDTEAVRHWRHAVVATIRGVRPERNGWQKRVTDATRNAITEAQGLGRQDTDRSFALPPIPTSLVPA